MEAVIMAAGKGSRLGYRTMETPKSLLKLQNGESILENSLSKLIRANIKLVHIVIGFKSKKIEEECDYLRKNYEIKINCIYNPFWNSCNVLGSLYLILNHIKSDYIFLHADTLFEEKILHSIKKIRGNVLAVNAKDVGDEEMKIWVDENFNLMRISKEQNGKKALGEFVGIAKFQMNTVNYFKKEIFELSLEYGNLNFYIEDALQRDLMNQNNFDLKMFVFSNLKTIEIDFEQDYLEALKLF